MKKMQTPENISSDQTQGSPQQMSWLDSVQPVPETRGGSYNRSTRTESFRNELAETSFEGIYIIQKGVYRFINSTAACYLGYSPEELVGQKAINFVHPEDREKAQEVARRLLKEKSRSPYEFRIVDREGQEFSILETVRSILFEGKPAVLANAVNLSVSKGVAEVLRQSEERSRTLFDNMEEGYFEVNLAGNLTLLNETFRNMIGYSMDELREMNYRAYIDQDDVGRVYEAYNLVFKTGKPVKWFEYGIRGKDGLKRTIEVSIFLKKNRAGKSIGFHGIARDVTRRKELETALKQSEEHYRTLLDNIPLGIAWMNPDYEIMFANAAHGRNFKKTPADFLGKKCYQEHEKREAVCANCPGTISMLTKKQCDTETEGVRDDGSRFTVRLITYPTFDPNGEVTGFIEIVDDITSWKKAQDDLRQSEERFSKAFQAGPVPTMILTPEEGRIIDVNESMLKLLGFEHGEMLGHSPLDLEVWVHPEDRSSYLQVFRNQGNLREEPVQFRSKSGEVKDLLWSAESIKIDNEEAMLSLFFDVTESKRGEAEKKLLESQLQQAHKMEAVGTLAGGIAHDFNNILASIIGFTEMTLHRDLPPGTRARHNLEQVLNASSRAKDLVHQILAFSRQQSQTQQPVQVIPAIKETLKLLRASLPSTIELRTVLSARDNTILAEPVQIQQILMNLCTNAAHSMREKGGILELQLSNVEFDMFEAQQKNIRADRYLKLSVVDTGTGIDPEIQARIFDPFFTTKSQGEGTGLGLSVVYGIVKSCGGAITVKSTPGEGSVFDLYFPVIKESDAGIIAGPSTAQSFPRGNETILYVDDEESLAILGKEMLSHLGYSVIPCSQSEAALNLFQAEPGQFDLVITDYTMPHMTGIELARKIFEIRPDIPIILATGFSAMITPEKARTVGIR
jgi:PAS domain S-box-containing protein